MKFEKLNGKDLINIGVFSAIYFVIIFILAMLGMIPIFLPLLAVLAPIFGGIPFMLFLTRVKKPGMIFIMAMIIGIVMLLTGMGAWPILTCAICGIAAELVYGSGQYKSASKAVLASGCFSTWCWGNFLPLYLNRDAYWEARQSFGQAYTDAVNKLMPAWTAPVLLIVAFVCGLLGGLLGKKLMKKHFEKAGIA